jgi:acetoin utilization deacetylase AcuC-like enzyme
VLPFKIVYHPSYDLRLGEHVFPSIKYRLVHDRLIEGGIAGPEDFVEPEAAPMEDLILVHTEDWVRRLRTGALRFEEILRMEIPYTKETIDAFWFAAGGTTLAARMAIRDGLGFNVGGGFHHAFPAHGEGFCAIHDVAVAIRVLQRDRVIERAMIVDCDVHHGNGTAAIFSRDASVMTVSLHQENNYPSEKPPSDIDVHLADGVGDEEYLNELQGAITEPMKDFRPDLVAYVAGADPYCEDQLGGLNLTIEGLNERDRIVFQCARECGAGVVVTLAGGYARKVEDTVTIHYNTFRAAVNAMKQ